VLSHFGAAKGTAGVVMLRLAPTQLDHPGRPAPYGDWHVTLSSATAIRHPIFAYISRSAGGLGALERGRQSTFAEAAAAGSSVIEKGTLSGLACGERLTVVGGYQQWDRAHAPYSSAGPSRDGRRAGPDFSAATETDAQEPGRSSYGNLSTMSCRLPGTSSAAPIAARYIAAGCHMSTPVPAAERYRLGKFLI